MSVDVIVIGAAPLTLPQVAQIAREDAQVRLAPEALEQMQVTRDIIDGVATNQVPRYGVTTGFGALATRHIQHDSRAQLQRSLVRSHAAGSGATVERDVVRAMMTLRLQTLASARTGVRPSTAQAYADLLNSGLTPVVYEYGSLGCSGDLAPLSHVALALMGEGEVHTPEGDIMPTDEAFAQAGLTPIELAEKEGLSLINGTDGMLGMLCLALTDLRELLNVADVAAALSIEALMGTDAVFAEEVVALRPHPGVLTSAANIRRLMQDSGIRDSHADIDCVRVQDAYSLRCAPQVHGAARDTLAHALNVATTELASVVDNPVVTPSGNIASNGSFHGAPLAYVLDFLAIVAADVASISERRTDRFCDPHRNDHLPAFLAGDPGLDSGHMIAQYTAAGIVSEMKRLAAPSSVDSIPSSAMQEDHVSMGWAGARKLRRSVQGLAQVLAIEILTACRAQDLRTPLQPAPALKAVRDALRAAGVEGPGPDRYLAPEIETAYVLVDSGVILAATGLTWD